MEENKNLNPEPIKAEETAAPDDKAAKKAEMDEKKNAIRAEDIARGVFIPVSNLPKREPQKGAITA